MPGGVLEACQLCSWAVGCRITNREWKRVSPPLDMGILSLVARSSSNMLATSSTISSVAHCSYFDGKTFGGLSSGLERLESLTDGAPGGADGSRGGSFVADGAGEQRRLLGEGAAWVLVSGARRNCPCADDGAVTAIAACGCGCGGLLWVSGCAVDAMAEFWGTGPTAASLATVLRLGRAGAGDSIKAPAEVLVEGKGPDDGQRRIGPPAWAAWTSERELELGARLCSIRIFGQEWAWWAWPCA